MTVSVRAGLIALATIKERTGPMASPRTYDIPLGRLFSVAPGIPTTDG
jgi:hypothetical protein